MPFKDKIKAKEYWREKKRQQRMSNPKVSNPVQPVTPAARPPLAHGRGLDPNETLEQLRERLQRMQEARDKALRK